MSNEPLRLYDDLASWFPIISPPWDYAEEAALYRDLILAALPVRPRALLELGSGAGCNASHLKRDFTCTLVEPAPGMLDASRRLNPECEHLSGDMRSVRLGRTFDVVFIHDAIAYMTTEADLALALGTAALHCRPGGVLLVAPDDVRETFAPSTHHGGSDGEGRSARFLEWTWDPDPTDTTYTVDFAYLLREGDVVRAVQDRHVLGLFPRATWLACLEGAGFDQVVAHPRTLDGQAWCEVFTAARRVRGDGLRDR